MALYLVTYSWPLTNSHWSTRKAVPVSTPAIRALGILTLVLGMRMNTPAKNSQVKTHEATSSNAAITGVMNSN